MKYPKIIAEIGSCHGGDLALAKKAIKTAFDSGAWAVKFQLFPNTEEFTKCGNIYLPREWWTELVEYAKSLPIEIFASVWDQEGYNLLLSTGCSYVKNAFSERMRFAGDLISIGSGDYLGDKYDKINLWCIPQYPVLFKICFDKVFEKFEGFSDHTLGIRQSINALRHGADYLEKHFRLDESPDCPDARFAINPKELEKLCEHQRFDRIVTDKRKEMGKW